ncbi:hypothetical protein N8368_04945 [Bacteroidia bacterium]|nr:hypothetical protein [Bacteroidia bacterium]
MLVKLRAHLVHLKNTNPWLLYLWLENQRKKGIKSLKEKSDPQAIIDLYQNYCGLTPDLENPSDWGEKMQWLKINYHNPLQTICSDKYAVRQFIRDKGYEQTLNDVHQHISQVSELDIESLPTQFVIKAAHGSGWNMVCKDKSKVNWFIWIKIFHSWLSNNIFWPGREWPYKNMPATIVVEKYLEDESGQLMDYKFFCFDGQPSFVQANKGRDTSEHAQNFYDLDWNILPFGKDLVPLPHVDIPKPSLLKEMIKMAKDLSEDFPFVRVDLYQTNGRIVFGELTFYPKSGLPDFVPSEYNQIIGDKLKLSIL